MSMNSIMFDEKREFTLYKELEFQVVQFAMDKIRLNTLKSLDNNSSQKVIVVIVGIILHTSFLVLVSLLDIKIYYFLI